MRITKNILGIVVFLFVSLSLFAIENKDGAVKEIQKEELLPIYRLDPYPSSGKVLFNAPSFICKPVIAEERGNNTFKFDYSYQYQFRVSKDPNFNDETSLVSPVQDWTFFNTHKKLEEGKWYWQYAYVKGDQKKWHEPISFTVAGDEEDFASPSFDELLSKIEQVHPRILATPEQLGKIKLPVSMKKELKKRIDKKIGKKLPTLIFDKIEVMAQKKKELNEERYQLYITKRTRDNCKKFSVETSEVVMLYLLTKEKRYLDEAINRYRYFKTNYSRIIELGQWLDFTEVAYHAVQAEVFDVAYDYLSAEERTEIVKELSEAQNKSFNKFLHKPAHSLHDSHFWQIELRNFFLNSLVLIGHTQEAEKWLNYAYDLYIVRAPTGSMNDGGWAPGNKYFSANQETLFVMPYLLSRITGFNYFSKPWYQNVSKYLMYTSPINHLTGSFGDGTDMSSENMLPLVKALNRVQKNSYGRFYEDLYNQIGEKESNYPRLIWYSNQPLELKIAKEKLSSEFKKAQDFRDVGNVAMHNDLKNPTENMFVAFRSSPYGVVGHSHAAQNAFSIFYGGEPLFYHTGYYTNWADFHSLQSYRHTRAHNSILVDGMGQNFHSSGYGWIPRFATGDVISYSVGDASRAYSGQITRDEIGRQMKKYGVTPTPEFGFGNPGLKKFRRHLFMLRPGIAIIYDVLEAEKAVEWSWLSNGRCLMKLDEDDGLVLESTKGKATMKLLSSVDYKQSLTDQFVSPPVDWQGKGAKKVKLDETSYHYKAVSSKSKNARFLAIIQVGDLKLKPQQIEKTKSGFKLGNWIIEAEMDVNKKAAFRITNNDNASISMGYSEVDLAGKSFKPEVEEATLLIEKKASKYSIQEEVDELPNAAIYY